jgi:hypothetical protein
LTLPLLLQLAAAQDNYEVRQTHEQAMHWLPQVSASLYFIHLPAAMQTADLPPDTEVKVKWRK